MINLILLTTHNGIIAGSHKTNRILHRLPTSDPTTVVFPLSPGSIHTVRSIPPYHPLRRNAAIKLLHLLPITIIASLQSISTRHVAAMILFFLILVVILLAYSHRLLLLPDGTLLFFSAFIFLADSALSNPNSPIFLKLTLTSAA